MATGDVTVGEFVQRLAKVKGVNAVDPILAADSLAAIGIYLPTYLKHSATLTEGDVALIARSAGLNVRSGNPEAVFDDSMVERFFTSFASDLNGGSESVFAPLGSGKGEGGNEGEMGGGKGKGKGGRTPTDPD